MLVFGGRDRDGYLADTWMRGKPGSWARVTPPRSPKGREQHWNHLNPVRERYVMFGGFGVDGLLNDTWEWDGVTWTERTPAISPPPRFGTQMAYDPDLGLVVLVGGRTVQEAIGGMWTWNGTTWTERTNVGLPASPHFSVQLGYDVQRSKLVYCGVGNSGSTPDRRSPGRGRPGSIPASCARTKST